MSDGNLITSKELLEKTGISRATLNNYIKMGILPKPIVRNPGPEQKGVKQIGYFPLSVLEHILKVKLLKQQGNSMDEIASIFQESSTTESIDATEVEEPVIESRPPEQISHRIQRRVSDDELSVTIEDITSPAYLLNHNFEIEWINNAAEDLIFNRSVKSITEVGSRNVFRLLMQEELRRGMPNWKDAVLLHLTVLQNRINEQNISSVYEGITDSDIKIITDLFAEKNISAPEGLYHLPVTLKKSDGSCHIFLYV